jgi:hypothetical protein
MTCKMIGDEPNDWPTLNLNDLKMNNDGCLH